MCAEHPLEARVRRHLLALGLGDRPVRLLVALSGGCDSVVLLHLLRFRLPALQAEVVAAHLDHGMRVASGEDADWVRGLCAAWDVPLSVERLVEAPRGEADARSARYAFLRRCAEEQGAELIATAHHADDQAETVLFRAVRGTGLKGLAGIAPLGGGLLRPLLACWRRDIEEYAAARRLRWRTDATNASLDPARNRLRHEVLPIIEKGVAPGARRSLVSLASLASEAEAALERIAADAEAKLVRWEDGAPSLARDRLRVYDSAIASRVLRNLLRHFGVVLGRTGTRRALQFITDAHSGRQMPLPGGIRIEIEFDRAHFRATSSPPPDRPLSIEGPGDSGEAAIRLGGADYRVRYGRAARDGRHGGEDEAWIFGGNADTLAFPLLVRAWRDGDRMRTQRGRRSLKRLFLDERVPRERRRRLPLLADATGEVLWVAELEAGMKLGGRTGDESFTVKLWHD
jgi:tRNA(Ile)-lysidine synthase